METRANYALVGIFTLAVMLSAFGFVYWMARYGTGGETVPLVVRIPGSANGLTVGSPVRFNGIQYGVVRRLDVDPSSPDFVIADTEVRSNIPIYTDTSAALEIQGLTGSAYIELQGGTPSNDNIIKKAIASETVAVIEADPSGVTNLLATADEILTRANRVIGEIEGFINDARSPLTETLRNAESFSAALRDNADGIDAFLKSVSSLSGTIESLSTKLEGTLGSVDRLITSVEPDKVRSIVSSVDKVTGDIAAASGGITETLESFRTAAGSLEGFVEEARAPLTETLKNAESFSATLSNNADGIDDFLKSLSGLSGTIESMTTKLEGTLGSVDQLVSAVDPEKVSDIVSSIDKVTGDFADSSGDITKTLESFRLAAESLKGFAADAGASLDGIDKVIAGIDPEKVGETVENIAAASADARKTLADARGVAETFSARREDFDGIITEVKEMSGRLNDASVRVDAVLAKVDGFLGEGDASSLLADVEQTLQSFRDVANSLNARIGPIADNLQRFTGTGLRDVETLVNDARRSIRRIEESISSIEKDPQRLLFGGDKVKQYDGRTRR